MYILKECLLGNKYCSFNLHFIPTRIIQKSLWLSLIYNFVRLTKLRKIYTIASRFLVWSDRIGNSQYCAFHSDSREKFSRRAGIQPTTLTTVKFLTLEVLTTMRMVESSVFMKLQFHCRILFQTYNRLKCIYVKSIHDEIIIDKSFIP